MVKAREEAVISERTTSLVLSFVAVPFAPATPPPLLSWTIPLIAPVAPPCGATRTARNRRERVRTTARPHCLMTASSANCAFLLAMATGKEKLPLQEGPKDHRAASHPRATDTKNA